MPEGLGPRFALEAGFLILLAGVAAYARLSATEIILVMAGGWLLASLFEVLAARRERLYPGAAWERRVEVVEKPAEREPERRLSWFRRPAEVAAPPEQEPAAAEAERVAAEAEPMAAEAEPIVSGQEAFEAEPEPLVPDEEPVSAEEEEEEVAVAAEPEPVSQPPSRQVDDEATGEIARAAPKRRWFRRTRPEPEERPAEVIARPSARHVRLIRGAESEGAVTEERQDAEAGS
jgi:hypothetical protein